MKNIKKSLLVIVAIALTTFASAQVSKKVDSITTIEINEMFKNVPFDVNENSTAKAFIKFNGENKIVNVKVLCDDLTMANFIKTRLSHTTIESENFTANKIYVLPIKIITKER